MKFYVKSGLTLGALAIAMLAMAHTASAQAQRASDKARGYYGPAASPDPADGFDLAPGVTGETMTGAPIGPGRRFSYAPAPRAAVAAPQAQAAPRARTVQPAPATRAPAASAPARRYSYSYQSAPVNQNGGFWSNDRVLSGNPANRNAAAKALGQY